MVNGTGVPASKYEAVLEHLATWGFIVIGNEDASSWDGVSSSASLDFLLTLNDSPDSVFYQKIDTNNIGIAGHSQGGVGAINAASVFENSDIYGSVYVASATWIDIAIAAEIVLQFRGAGLPIHLICACPFPNCEKSWDYEWQKRYKTIMEAADFVRFICPQYSRGCFQLRNEWLINHSSRVIAVFNGLPGGTKNTIAYAARQGIPIYFMEG